MGKASKNRRKDYRKAMKKARKAAQKAKYAEWASSGKNSKRSKLRRARANKVRTKRHAIVYCGNVGCKRCHPETAVKPLDRWRYDRVQSKKSSPAKSSHQVSEKDIQIQEISLSSP